MRSACAEAIYIYIYIYICLSRFCACAAHAQDNNNNNYLYVQWVAMVFLVYFPRRFGMQLPLVAKVLREASALMRISSILYIIIYIYVCHASGPAKDPFKCATRKRRTGQ